jgi:cytochrome b561
MNRGLQVHDLRRPHAWASGFAQQETDTMIERYSKPAVVLHWLIAIGIFINLYLGLRFDDMAKDHVRAAVDLHKSIGITVLGLVVLRLLWRVAHTPPAPMASLKPWERKLSVGIHHLLYLLSVLVPLAGWLHDSAWKDAAKHPLVLFRTVPWFRIPLFGGLDPAAKDQAHELLGDVHSALSWVLMAALLLHVAAALKHQVLGREKMLQRMWFGR